MEREEQEDGMEGEGESITDSGQNKTMPCGEEGKGRER